MRMIRIANERFMEDQDCLKIELDLSSVVDVESFFGVFADNVFPDYFGYNWNAFDECIQDLSWYTNRNILFRIKRFERILSMSIADVRHAIECICSACKQNWDHCPCFLLEIEDEQFDEIEEIVRLCEP